MQESSTIQQTQYRKGTIFIALVDQALSATHEKSMNNKRLLEKVGISAELQPSYAACFLTINF